MNSNANADGFWSGIVASPNSAGFSHIVQWKDPYVWDSDFLDPNMDGTLCTPGPCDDTDNFDQANMAISFYAGHGAQLPKSSTNCTSYLQCTAAKAPVGTTVGTSGYGTCIRFPTDGGNGICNYTPSSNTVNPTLDVCGSEHNNHNHVQLGYMALGETPTVGAWRGAGTNGGTSLAIIHMSFGMWTFYPISEWSSAFAGLHLFAGISVSTNDVDDAANFGSIIAEGYPTNPLSLVQEQYTGTIGLDMEGLGCAGSSYSHGGFNGCGCLVIMSISSTDSGAYNAFNEDWLTLTDDLSTQNGTGYWYYSAQCNYDIGANPWSGGDN